MESRHGKHYWEILMCALGGIFVWVFTGGPTASGQIKLPKILKVAGKMESTPREGTNPSKETGPAPELLQISPDSAPPGGIGELLLTGKNFTKGLRLIMWCGKPMEELATGVFKLENSGRARAQIKIPFHIGEETCTMLGLMPPLGGLSEEEEEESVLASREVVQVAAGGPTFRISKSAKMAVGVVVLLVGEGDLNFMELMQKMQGEMAGGFGKGGMKKGQLLVSPDSIEFVQEGKTVFSERASSVKEVEEMTVMGQSAGGAFRIVFTSGKIYNFQPEGEGGEESGREAFQFVKKKLGK